MSALTIDIAVPDSADELLELWQLDPAATLWHRFSPEGERCYPVRMRLAEGVPWPRQAGDVSVWLGSLRILETTSAFGSYEAMLERLGDESPWYPLRVPGLLLGGDQIHYEVRLRGEHLLRRET